jgi:hypothetical protein
VKRFLGVVLACMSAQVASAQMVGFPPARSPFVDVDQTQELTPFIGYFSAKHDPAKVAPTGALTAGLQYEWRGGGPFHIGMDFMYVNSTRTPQDPSKPFATRSLGSQPNPLYAVDGFMALSLTGDRSWHHVIPMAIVGAGLISDFKGPDVGGFQYGTQFTVPWGLAVRWVPGGRFQLRADARDWLYRIAYPEGYYISTTTDSPILSATTPRSKWGNNFALTLGLSWFFSH